MCLFGGKEPKPTPPPAPAPLAPVAAPEEQVIGARRKAEEKATFGGRGKPSFRTSRKAGVKTSGGGGINNM